MMQRTPVQKERNKEKARKSERRYEVRHTIGSIHCGKWITEEHVCLFVRVGRTHLSDVIRVLHNPADHLAKECVNHNHKPCSAGEAGEETALD